MAGWVDLKAESDAGRVGCLFVLAAVLLVIGCGTLAVFFIDPAGKGDVWVMPLVGGAFTLVGVLLLYGGIRGARGASIPAAALAVEEGSAFRAGSEVRLRLRQPGPVRLESLALKASCERVYREKVKPNSSSTVERHDVMWERVLLDVRDEEVPRGGVLEREAVFALPPDARPSGEARPHGKIRWKLEVLGEAGFMRATYRAYKIRVEGDVQPAAEGAGAGMAARGAAATDWSAVFKTPEADRQEKAADSDAASPPVVHRPKAGGGGSQGLSVNAGCLVIAVSFVFGGSFFLWAFFSGAAFRGRGNPYMALFGGLLFGGLGLLGVAGVVFPSMSSRMRRRRRTRR